MYLLDKTKSFLCLLLALFLASPPSLWSRNRDLQVEELKEAALWVLTVGVSRYEDPGINLKYAHNDALAIAEIFETQAGVLFREVITHTLIDEEVTREDILKEMRDFLGQASRSDVILIFMSGHGVQDPQTGTYYFLPHNAAMDNLDYNGLQMHSIEDAFRRLSSHTDKVILLLDTCHSGAVRIAARGLDLSRDLSQPLIDELITTILDVKGQYILSASMDGEIATEDADYRMEGSDQAHGAFTYSLLLGLRGKAADDKDGVVWLSDLFKHVNRHVSRLTGGQQHPHGQIFGMDLPLFISGTPVDRPDPKPIPVPLPMVDSTFSDSTSELAESESDSTLRPADSTSASFIKKKWLWFLLGATAVGGAAAVWLPPEEATGEIRIHVKVP